VTAGLVLFIGHVLSGLWTFDQFQRQELERNAYYPRYSRQFRSSMLNWEIHYMIGGYFAFAYHMLITRRRFRRRLRRLSTN
jgi:hypothetical protein